MGLLPITPANVKQYVTAFTTGVEHTVGDLNGILHGTNASGRPIGNAISGKSIDDALTDAAELQYGAMDAQMRLNLLPTGSMLPSHFAEAATTHVEDAIAALANAGNNLGRAGVREDIQRGIDLLQKSSAKMKTAGLTRLADHERFLATNPVVHGRRSAGTPVFETPRTSAGKHAAFEISTPEPAAAAPSHVADDTATTVATAHHVDEAAAPGRHRTPDPEATPTSEPAAASAQETAATAHEPAPDTGVADTAAAPTAGELLDGAKPRASAGIGKMVGAVAGGGALGFLAGGIIGSKTSAKEAAPAPAEAGAQGEAPPAVAGSPQGAPMYADVAAQYAQGQVDPATQQQYATTAGTVQG